MQLFVSISYIAPLGKVVVQRPTGCVSCQLKKCVIIFILSDWGGGFKHNSKFLHLNWRENIKAIQSQ